MTCFIYLASGDHAADTVAIFDRVDADNQGRPERYYDGDRDRINAAPQNKQFILHALEQPTLASDSANLGGERPRVALTSLLPAQRNARVVDEKALPWPKDFPRRFPRALPHRLVRSPSRPTTLSLSPGGITRRRRHRPKAPGWCRAPMARCRAR